MHLGPFWDRLYGMQSKVWCCHHFFPDNNNGRCQRTLAGFDDFFIRSPMCPQTCRNDLGLLQGNSCSVVFVDHLRQLDSFRKLAFCPRRPSVAFFSEGFKSAPWRSTSGMEHLSDIVRQNAIAPRLRMYQKLACESTSWTQDNRNCCILRLTSFETNYTVYTGVYSFEHPQKLTPTFKLLVYGGHSVAQTSWRAFDMYINIFANTCDVAHFTAYFAA